MISKGRVRRNPQSKRSGSWFVWGFYVGGGGGVMGSMEWSEWEKTSWKTLEDMI